MKSQVLLILLSFALFVPSLVDAREWTDKTGRFSVEAELVEVKDGMAVLKKADGTVISVAVEKLSDSDRTYLKGVAAKAEREAREKRGVTVGKPSKIAERIEPNSELGRFNTFKSGIFVVVRCTVTTGKSGLTIGSRKGKQATSDIVEFKDFNLLFGEDRKSPAVALGHKVAGPTTLSISPDEYANIVSVNRQQEFEWEIEVVFALPKYTREAKFAFRGQEPVVIEIPGEPE